MASAPTGLSAASSAAARRRGYDQPRMPGRRPSTLLLVTACLAAAAGEAGEPLRLSGGETALELNRHILADLGIELVARRRPVGEEGEFARLVLPMTPDPSLRVRASGGSFEALEGGALRHQGGFQLLWRDGRQSLAGFELRPGPAPTLFELHTADGAVPLILDSPHPQLLAAAGEFAFLNMDLRLTAAFARRLGVPRLAGAAIGSADVRLRLAAVPEADGVVWPWRPPSICATTAPATSSGTARSYRTAAATRRWSARTPSWR